MMEAISLNPGALVKIMVTDVKTAEVLVAITPHQHDGEVCKHINEDTNPVRCFGIDLRTVEGGKHRFVFMSEQVAEICAASALFLAEEMGFGPDMEELLGGDG